MNLRTAEQRQRFCYSECGHARVQLSNLKVCGTSLKPLYTCCEKDGWIPRRGPHEGHSVTGNDALSNYSSGCVAAGATPMALQRLGSDELNIGSNGWDSRVQCVGVVVYESVKRVIGNVYGLWNGRRQERRCVSAAGNAKCAATKRSFCSTWRCLWTFGVTTDSILALFFHVMWPTGKSDIRSDGPAEAETETYHLRWRW